MIRSFKSKYRVRLLQHIISKVEGKNLTASNVEVDILMAMNWCKLAWESVSSQTIRNCFIKAFFKREPAKSRTVIELDEQSDDEIQEISQLLSKINDQDIEVDAENYVTADDKIITSDPDPNIVIVEDDVDIDDSKESEESGEESPTAKDAIAAMEILTRFFYANNFMSQTEFNTFETRFNTKVESMKKQTAITDFFSRK